jgi:hypothetical protein
MILKKKASNTVRDRNKFVAVQGVCNCAFQVRYEPEADIFSSEVNGHSTTEETVKQCNYIRNDE